MGSTDMRLRNIFLLVTIPVAGVVACGGGDTAAGLDLADPVVRFVHVSLLASNVALYRVDTCGPASIVASRSCKVPSGCWLLDRVKQSSRPKTIIGKKI
jgi:hypothetical protein